MTSYTLVNLTQHVSPYYDTSLVNKGNRIKSQGSGKSTLLGICVLVFVYRLYTPSQKFVHVASLVCVFVSHPLHKGHNFR